MSSSRLHLRAISILITSTHMVARLFFAIWSVVALSPLAMGNPEIVVLSPALQYDLDIVIGWYAQPDGWQRRNDLESWRKTSRLGNVVEKSKVWERDGIFVIERKSLLPNGDHIEISLQARLQYATASQLERFLSGLHRRIEKAGDIRAPLSRDDAHAAVRKISDYLAPRLSRDAAVVDPNDFHQGHPRSDAPRGWYFKTACRRGWREIVNTFLDRD
jgi:hypothetical protein